MSKSEFANFSFDNKKHWAPVYKKIEKEKIKSIDAGWKVFSLEFVDNIEHEGDMCFGLTNFDYGFIHLKPEVSNDLAIETLLHELTHVVLEFLGLGDDTIQDISNEDLTTRISRGFTLLMALNPALFNAILHCES